MELSWLETFIVLAESNSMRTAAAKLGISPATASERISALEYELGTRLLVRNSKGSELSEAGKLFAESSRQILKNWDSILEIIKPIENTPFQRLRIGLPDRVMVPCLGRTLDSFVSDHPHIELNLYSDQEFGISESLRDGTADVFFSFEPSEAVLKGRISRVVHHTRMGILVPSDHRLALQGSVSLSELNGETFVLYPAYRDSSLHDFQKKMLKNSDIQYLEYSGHFSPSLYALTVKMGCGLVIFPNTNRKGIPPRSVFLEIKDDSARCDIYMIYDPSNTNPALQLFLDEFGDQEGTDEG